MLVAIQAGRDRAGSSCCAGGRAGSSVLRRSASFAARATAARARAPRAARVVVVAAFVAGYLTEIFGVLWDTTYQQEIPHEKLSRLSAYDALGSWVLMPIGYAVAGPVAAAVGNRATFIGAAVLVVVRDRARPPLARRANARADAQSRAGCSRPRSGRAP